MRRAHRLILTSIALFLMLVVPLAGAQAASVTLKIQPPDEDIMPGERVVLHGVATYTTDATASASTIGIPVAFYVTDAPMWLSAVMASGSDVFVMPATPAVTATSTVPFTVIVDAPENATAPLAGILEITAVASGSAITPAVGGSTSIPVSVIPADAPACDDGFAVQANHARPLSSPDTIGGLALAGSAWGIGLGVAIAGRRPKLLGILAGLALGGLVLGFAMPTAAAQGSATSFLKIQVLDEKVGPGDHIQVPAVLTFLADATAYANTAGIPVAYSVTASPPGWTITINPSADVLFMPATPSVTAAVMATFTVDIIVDHEINASELAYIGITAMTPRGAATPATMAAGGIPVSVHVPRVCESLTMTNEAAAPQLNAADEDALAVPASTRAPEATTGDEAPVSVQSNANALRTGLPAIAAAGVLGALVGFVLYRRLR